MLISILVALLVAALLSWWFSSSRGRWLVLDIPNERSLHTTPVPRAGGIAILAGVVAGFLASLVLMEETFPAPAVFFSILVLAIVSLIDDYGEVGIVVRLLAQAGVALVLLFALGLVDGNLLVSTILLLFLVWMINLYNFMDGMDGFAGGMGCIGFTTFALIAWQNGATELALICAITAAANCGFLLFNFPPARIFMGDTGSTLLGLLAGCVILYSHDSVLVPLWLGILVFSPFFVDATVTLTRRILHLEVFWKPHKKHYYQRVVQYGWGHGRTVLCEYVLMLACGNSVIIGVGLPVTGQWLIIGGWVFIYLLLMVAIQVAEKRKDRRNEIIRSPP